MLYEILNSEQKNFADNLIIKLKDEADYELLLNELEYLVENHGESADFYLAQFVAFLVLKKDIANLDLDLVYKTVRFSASLLAKTQKGDKLSYICIAYIFDMVQASDDYENGLYWQTLISNSVLVLHHRLTKSVSSESILAVVITAHEFFFDS